MILSDTIQLYHFVSYFYFKIFSQKVFIQVLRKLNVLCMCKYAPSSRSFVYCHPKWMCKWCVTHLVSMAYLTFLTLYFVLYSIKKGNKRILEGSLIKTVFHFENNLC